MPSLVILKIFQAWGRTRDHLVLVSFLPQAVPETILLSHPTTFRPIYINQIGTRSLDPQSSHSEWFHRLQKVFTKFNLILVLNRTAKI